MGSPNPNLGDFYLLACSDSFHPPLTPSPCTNRHTHTHIHTHRSIPESHTHTQTQTETYTESHRRTHRNIHRVTHTYTLGHRVFRDYVACIHHSVFRLSALSCSIISYSSHSNPSRQLLLIPFCRQEYGAPEILNVWYKFPQSASSPAGMLIPPLSPDPGPHLSHQNTLTHIDSIHTVLRAKNKAMNKPDQGLGR